jgi:hypothetical protein
MSVLLSCSNKGCFSQDYHKLEMDSGKVICNKCLLPIEVTDNFKKILKSQDQVIRKPKMSMGMKCPACTQVSEPVLFKYSKTLFKVGCSLCKEVNEHLTKYFLISLREKSGIKIFDFTSPEDVSDISEVSALPSGVVVVNKSVSVPSPGPSAVADDSDSDHGSEKTAARVRPKIKISKKKLSEEIPDIE